MNVLLTGLPRSGKTTLLAKLVAHEKNKQGFLTREIREDGERVGFKLVSASEEAVLAHIRLKTSHKVSRYSVDIGALDQFIEPLFKFTEGQLLYIDEIAQMELFSERFKELTRLYLQSSNDFIGTLTSVYSDEFVDWVRSFPDVRIIKVTPENREQLVTELKL